MEVGQGFIQHQGFTNVVWLVGWLCSLNSSEAGARIKRNVEPLQSHIKANKSLRPSRLEGLMTWPQAPSLLQKVMRTCAVPEWCDAMDAMWLMRQRHAGGTCSRKRRAIDRALSIVSTGRKCPRLLAIAKRTPRESKTCRACRPRGLRG